MKFNQAQEQAIFNEHSLVVVSAGAGSGKTRVLTERIVYLCELKRTNPQHRMGVTIDEIVAITFTEKAAREMKDRIRSRINEKIADSKEDEEQRFWLEQKDALERTIISTFHSFCQQILSQYAIYAKLPPRIKVIDELEANQLKKELIQKLFQQSAFVERAEPFFDYLSKDSLTDYLFSILNQMREWFVGPSKVQELRVEEMVEIQKAAVGQQLIEKIQSFHTKANDYIRQFPAYDELTAAQKKHVQKIENGFADLHERLPVGEYIQICEECMPSRTDKKWQEKIPPLYDLFELEWKPLKKWWKDMSGSLDFSEQSVDLLKRLVELIKQFDYAYQSRKDYLGLVDFSDLQQKAVSLLNNLSIQAACRKQYRHFMVDEFQDTNQLQLEMLKRIDPDYQFIVGDTKQSIYRFRGANVSLMNQLEEGAETSPDAETILMNMNYRTTDPVIQTVNHIFSSIMKPEPDFAFETKYTALEAAREPESFEKKSIELFKTDEDEDQYIQLAKRLVTMMEEGKPLVNSNGVWQEPSWKDIAILIPTRTQLLQLERALTSYQIPYTVYGGIAFFQRQEVIDFSHFIRWLNRPFEDLYLTALLRSPLIGLTLNELLDIQEHLEEGQSLYEFLYTLKNELIAGPVIFEAALKLQGWLEVYISSKPTQSTLSYLQRMFEDIGLKNSLLLQENGLQKVKNVEKLIGLLEQNQCRLYEEMVEVIDERMQLSEKEGEAEMERLDGDALHIMTVHASKGLEFPIVCLPQMDRRPRPDTGIVRFHSELGIVFRLESDEEEEQMTAVVETPGYPIAKDLGNLEAREEEKRLFYVAATRARDHLLMVGCEKGSKHSWLEMVEFAKNATGLSQLIEEEIGALSERAWSPKGQNYDAPKLLKSREVLTPLSVSEVMTFIHDKGAYFERYVLGLEEERNSNEQSPTQEEALPIKANEFGTIVHKACELLDNGIDEEQAIDESLNKISEADVKGKVRLELQELLKTYNQDIRAQLGRPVANEWSFSFPLAQAGAEIIGEIDKIVEREGIIHLIDFKTNKIEQTGGELLSIYEPQLYLYKMAYEYQVQKEVESTSLFVFRDQHQPIHSLVFSKANEKRLMTEIQELVRRKKTAETKSEWLASSQ
ncbi:UvrD-helicase domain-containing protein [Alkalihalobacillus sp. 1P02AB]|uniref:UvrD-helicase domain-containing protein n=1 Tax=Alkalihalobacillus sp. 1P02AB TaxID=3132260 RepID=UPI0039A4FE67